MYRSRPWRRYKNYTKARRKYELDKELSYMGVDFATGEQRQYLYYKHLHEYSKNKIHCSCPMCSAKTRNKGSRKTWAPALNYKPSDRRRVDSWNNQMEELYESI